jgi:hypothetical protein
LPGRRRVQKEKVFMVWDSIAFILPAR